MNGECLCTKHYSAEGNGLNSELCRRSLAAVGSDWCMYCLLRDAGLNSKHRCIYLDASGSDSCRHRMVEGASLESSSAAAGSGSCRHCRVGGASKGVHRNMSHPPAPRVRMFVMRAAIKMHSSIQKLRIKAKES